MLQRISVAAVLACVLAACSPPAQQQADGSAPANGNASMASGLEPGQYRTTITMLEMSIPGAGPQNPNAPPTTTEDCVTASDIADFTRSSLVEADSGETCTQNSMNSAGGHIDGQATCTSETGTRTMRMSGTYTSNHIDMEIASTSAMPGNGGNMTLRMHMVSDRIGACTTGTN